MHPLLQIALSNVAVAAALAITVALVTRVWKNRHVAHLLWLLVLVKLVTPPLWKVPVSIDSPATEAAVVPITQRDLSPAPIHRTIDEPASLTPDSFVLNAWQPAVDVTPSVSTAPSEPPARIVEPAVPESPPHKAEQIDWSWLVLCVWITTSALWLIAAAVRVGRFHRLVRHSPPADARLLERVEELAPRLGLRTPPAVRLLDGNVSPMVWPLTWRRLLLLPRKLLDELTLSQLDTVIAHELAHLVRRDDLVRFLEAAVTGLFWWNPVVWWARRELHRAEEDCCDALVVCALPESRRQYGEALLRAAEIVTFGRSLPALASAFAQQRFLKRRIEMILQQEFRRGLSWHVKVCLLALAAAVLPLAATAVSQDEPATTAPNQPPATSSQQADSGAGLTEDSHVATDARSTASPVVAPDPAAFTWDDPQRVNLATAESGKWTFIDLDTGLNDELSADDARSAPIEERGYDIRLQVWVDEFDHRTSIVAVLHDMAFQELPAIEAVGGMTYTEIARADLRNQTIHPSLGIFRTNDGGMGILEVSTMGQSGILQYELTATATAPPMDPANSFNPVTTATDPQTFNQVAGELATQPVIEPGSIVTWPAQPAVDPASVADAISTDDEVLRLELELLILDEQAVRLQLEAESEKLEYLTRATEQGVVGVGDLTSQQLTVDLLQIDVARARIRRELFETRMNRLQGTDSTSDAQSNVSADPDAGTLFSNAFLPDPQTAEPTGTSGDPNLNSDNPPVTTPEEQQRLLDALNLLNQNSLNTPGDPELQRRIEQYEEAFRAQSAAATTEARFPRPVQPEAPLAIVSGVLVNDGQPIANQVIWIIGEVNGETVLYQDGPTGDDGRFEFTDVPVNRPWQIFVPINNGPAGVASNSVTLTDTADAAIDVWFDGETVQVTPMGDAATESREQR